MKRYHGESNGQTIQSLYPNLYCVQCEACIGGRLTSVDQIISACDSHHARERIGKLYRDIRGSIAVDHIGTLEEVES